jgi:vacuolar-type H+-ATPase subunit H
LRPIADAVDCDVIYALVPRRPVEEILRDRARAKARLLIQAADVHMSLEDQQVSRSLERRIEELAEQLIADGKVW